jgi:hypothetical protein
MYSIYYHCKQLAKREADSRKYFIIMLQTFMLTLQFITPGVPNFEQKKYFAEDGRDHCFVGIPPVSRNKRLTEFRFESFTHSAEGENETGWRVGGVEAEGAG